MRDYRPLLFRQIGVRLPGLHLLRLRLNRHLPETDALESHVHSFTQILCYLSGRGILKIGDSRRGAETQGKVGRTRLEVGPGTIAFLPPGVRHGFQETGGRRPLALAMDLEYRAARRAVFRFGRLGSEDAGKIRGCLSELARVQGEDFGTSRLLAGAAALSILDIQLRAVGLLPGRRVIVPGFVRKFRALASDPDHAALSIGDLARRTGYQPDYLNRRFREVTGLTLSAQRDALRLDRARRLLSRGMPVAEAALGAGFDDPNYFARWFRRQTGEPPSRAR